VTTPDPVQPSPLGAILFAFNYNLDMLARRAAEDGDAEKSEFVCAVLELARLFGKHRGAVEKLIFTALGTAPVAEFRRKSEAMFRGATLGEAEKIDGSRN